MEISAQRTIVVACGLVLTAGLAHGSPAAEIRARMLRIAAEAGLEAPEAPPETAALAAAVPATAVLVSQPAGPENLTSIGGVDISPLVGTYALKKNKLGDHPDNRCDAALIVRAVQDRYGERLEFLSPEERQRQDSTEDGEWKEIMVRQGFRYSGVNAGRNSYRPGLPPGARPVIDMKERIDREVALVAKGPGALELTSTFNYRDRFASGSGKDVFALAGDGTLGLVHSDIHSLKWYQYESGVDRSKPGYRKPNYDKDCEYAKTAVETP